MKYFLFVFVLWKVGFTGLDGALHNYSMRQELKTFEEAKRFVDWSPQESFDCESSRYNSIGQCVLSDFEIRS